MYLNTKNDVLNQDNNDNININTDIVNYLTDYKNIYEEQLMKAKYIFEKGDVMKAKCILNNMHYNDMQNNKFYSL